MLKNNFLRKLLPKNEEIHTEYLERGSWTKQRRISLACTECQKKKSKCSGTAPCTRCANGGWKCLYNLAGDRRRKAHTAELLNFRDALRRIAAKLRSGTPEEISQLIWEIQNLPTDQDAVSYLADGCLSNGGPNV